MASSPDFQNFIDEVIERNDIVEVISAYTQLKRVGSRYQALCPLHNDRKTPSFSVSPDKQLFHCFGCGAGGNVIHFIQRRENLDFMDALKLLADRAHLQMPDTRSLNDKAKQARLQDKKQRMYQMNSAAGKYFFKTLTSPQGSAAQEYLKKRELTPATVKRFGLGYADGEWTSLLDYLDSLGFSAQEAEEAGLAVRRENGTYYDKFRDRLMFPIIDLRGNVIGFGGRILVESDNAPKYLNSPETLVFQKSENLYGMNFAKNDNSGYLLLMEGYMDVIALHQSGITNAAASLGTAFTPQQARIVKRYAGKAVLCYDSDEAGQKATLRAGDILTNAEVKTKVLTLTDGKDPDEFIKAKGPDMFRVLIHNAEALIEYKIRRIKEKYNLESDEDKISFIEEAAGVFAEMKNPVEQEVYIKKIARESDVSPDAILTEVRNLERKQQRLTLRREERAEKRSYEERTGGRRNLEQMKIYNAEKLLLNLLTEREVFRRVSKEIQPEDFSSELHKKLAHILYGIHQRGEPVRASEILEQFEESQLGQVSELLIDDKNVGDKRSAAEMPLQIMKQGLLKSAEQELLKKDELPELQKVVDELKKRKQGGNPNGK